MPSIGGTVILQHFGVSVQQTQSPLVMGFDLPQRSKLLPLKFLALQNYFCSSYGVRIGSSHEHRGRRGGPLLNGVAGWGMFGILFLSHFLRKTSHAQQVGRQEG